MARSQPGNTQTVEMGPFAAVTDSTAPGQARVKFLRDSVNMVIPDPDNGSEIAQRHGMTGHSAQLGATGARTGQKVYPHRRLDGTLDKFIFIGGKMYRWDGGTTYTDVTPASIKIDTSNPVFCASFNDYLIVSDGANKPWAYNPSSGAATPIEYNAALDEWCAQGAPQVYEGRLFFILKMVGQASITTEDGFILITEDGYEITTEPLSGDQNAIIWSIEGDPFTGYQQTDYDNVWQLTQTSSELIYAIHADEGALVYFRERGIGMISGEVSTDFRSSATKDSISQTIGCRSPAAIVAKDRTLFFPDVDGRMHRLDVGGGPPVELWTPMRGQIQATVGDATHREDVSSLARAAYHEEYDVVLVTLWRRDRPFVFDATSGAYIGTWKIGAGAHIDAMGSMLDSNGRTTFCVIGSRNATRSDATMGVFWRQNFPDDTYQWLDVPDRSAPSTTVSFDKIVETSTVNKDPRMTVVAGEVNALFTGAGGIRPDLAYITPRGASDYINASIPASTSTTDDTDDAVGAARWQLGPNAQGRTLRFKVRCVDSVNQRWGVHSIAVDVRYRKARRGAR